MKKLFHMKKEDENRKSAEEYLLLIPVLFAVCVIPLIMKAKAYNLGMQDYEWFPSVHERVDYFNYYKTFAVTVMFAVLCCITFVLYFRHKLKGSRIFILLAVYAGFILLSSMFSISEFHTWNGFMEMFESAFVWLCYCLVCFYCYEIIRSEKQLKLVWIFFVIGIILMGIIGFSQFIGHDLLMTDWVRKLIFSKDYEWLMGTVDVTGVKVYTTLYNPNYVGIYSCITVPMLFVLTFLEKNKKTMGLYLLLAVPAMICLVGSGSKTAVLAMMPSLLLASVFFWKRYWKSLLPILAAYVGMFTLLNMLQPSSVFMQTMDRLSIPYLENKSYHLSDITLNDDNYTLTYDESRLYVTYDEKDGVLTPVVSDDTGEKLLFTKTGDTWESADERFEELQFTYEESEYGNVGFLLESEECPFFIYYSEEERTYLYENYYGDGVKMYTSPTWDLPFFHLMGGFSGRAYIWSKTLPLLKDTIFVGTGPDTYAIKFPQMDYLAAVQNGWESIMVTKPHCMYLQIAVQSGVVALIVFLAFELCYMVQSFRLYRKKEIDSFAGRFGAAVLLMNFAFLIASVMNDSTVGVSIVYWIMLGCGFAANYIFKNGEGSLKSNKNLKCFLKDNNSIDELGARNYDTL